MRIFKYCCAILALAYLVGALLPASLIGAQHNRAGSIAPEWVGRGFSGADFLILGAVFYCVQKRKQIYWKLIPALLGIFLLSVLIPLFWSVNQLSLPLIPFLFIFVIVFIGALFFIPWWRSQKNHFVEH